MSTTLTDIQTEISAAFEQSGTPISNTSSEWDRRKYMLRAAEREFKAQKKWKFRLKTAVLTATGTVDVALPSDCKMSSLSFDKTGYLTVGGNAYKLINYSEKLNYLTDSKFCWITGNESIGFSINFQPTLASGISVPIQYYSNNLATDSGGTEQEFLNLPSDITLIPNPSFLVFRALEKITLLNGDDAVIPRTYRDDGDRVLSQMIKLDFGEENQYTTVQTGDEELGYIPFGSYI